MNKTNCLTNCLLSILFVFIMVFSSCEMGGVAGLPVSSDSETPADTALSSVLGNYPLLPPSNIQAAGADLGNKLVLSIFWDSVSYAESYKVYRAAAVDGPFTPYDVSFSSEFEDTVTLLSGSTSVSWFYKVSSINKNDIESNLSTAVQGTVSIGGNYSGKVTFVSLTKGTQSAVAVSWSPEPEAFSYQIRRVVSGDLFDNAVIVKSIFVPVDNTVSLLSFSDNSVEPAVLYDYWVISSTQSGIQGEVSDRAVDGYVRPYAAVAFGSHGSSVRGETPDYSFIDLRWFADWKQSDINGLVDGSEVYTTPGRWAIDTTFTPADNSYSSMDDVYFAGTDELSALKDASLHLHLTDGLAIDSGDDDLLTNADQWTQDDSVNQLFYRLQTEDLDISGTIDQPNEISNRREFLYRISVDDINVASNENFNTSWGQSFFFQVSAVFNEGSQLEYWTPVSPMQMAYAIDPANSVLTTTNLNAESVSSVVNVTWDQDLSASKYLIYRKNRIDFKFSLIAELDPALVEEIADPTAPAFEDSDIDLTPGETYYYAIAISDGSDISELSLPVAVEIIQ